jgi:hypothetical protein
MNRSHTGDREGCQTEEQAGAGPSSRALSRSFARAVRRGACGNSFLLTLRGLRAIPAILHARLMFWSSSASASIDTRAWISFSRVLMVLSPGKWLSRQHQLTTGKGSWHPFSCSDADCPLISRYVHFMESLPPSPPAVRRP